ncbi:MAG: hypothetical protein KY453_04465 [Gemmatimonadetes bacterium]|nr:hypothetical protein [Gemmatimonadota bacterium]
MSELVHEFSLPLNDEEGRTYTARIRGEEDENGHWEGWIEFLPRGEGSALRTRRETTQSRYEHLSYWASGLSDDYLEMALRRAHPAEDRASPPPLEEVEYDPGRIGEPVAGSAVAEIVLETLETTLPRRLMVRQDLEAGQVRRIRGAGILVYEGVEAGEGEPSRHRFLAQYGSPDAAAVMANHLWSQLHDEDVTVYVGGREVPLLAHDLGEALRARL